MKGPVVKVGVERRRHRRPGEKEAGPVPASHPFCVPGPPPVVWGFVVHEPVEDPSPGGPHLRTKYMAAEIRAGEEFQATDGTGYVVARDGSVRRTAKPEGTKRERRLERRRARARAAEDAVDAARGAEVLAAIAAGEEELVAAPVAAGEETAG